MTTKVGPDPEVPNNISAWMISCPLTGARRGNGDLVVPLFGNDEVPPWVVWTMSFCKEYPDSELSEFTYLGDRFTKERRNK